MTFKDIVSRLLTIALALVLSLGVAFEAEAKRMGGGKSMGRQSSNVTQREAARTPPTNQQQAAGNAAAQQQTRKPWGAILGGLAAGLGLAWLANSLGLGEGFANLLMLLLLGVAVVAIIGMVRRSRAVAPQGAQAGGMAYQGAAPGSYNPAKVGNDAAARPWEGQSAAFSPAQGMAAGGSMIGSALSGSQSWGIPAGFDVAGFTEAAKRNFITLQDAWDRADIPALRAMMTDEMLAEIKADLAQRAVDFGAGQKTEVLALDAQLLGIEETDVDYLASVEFSGMVREDAAAGPTPMREVWNMVKPKNGPGGWLVAGVQALQ